MNDIIQTLGGRKFVISLALLVLSCTMAVMGFFRALDISAWMEMIKWVLIIYCGGNVVDKFAMKGEMDKKE